MTYKLTFHTASLMGKLIKSTVLALNLIPKGSDRLRTIGVSIV